MWQFLIELYKTRALYSILTKFGLFIIWRTDIKKKYSFHFCLEIDQRKHRIFNSSSFLFLFSFFSLSFSSSFFSLLPPQLQPTIEKLIYLLYITTLTINSTSQSPIYNTPYKFFFFFFFFLGVSHNEDQHNPNNLTTPTQHSATATHTQ